MRIRTVSREEPALNNLEARDAQPLRARITRPRARLFVAPRVAGAGVEEHRDQEQVDQATRALLVVDRLGPRLHELVDAGSAADVEVLPPAVRRDRGVVSVEVALQHRSVQRHARLVRGQGVLALIIDTT